MKIIARKDTLTGKCYIVIDQGEAGEYIYTEGEVFTYQGIMYEVNSFVIAFQSGFATVFTVDYGLIFPLIW